MLLDVVSLEGIRNLPDQEFRLRSATAVSLITGDPGAGKTSLLEAVLAVMSAHLGVSRETAAWLSPRRTTGLVELTWSLSAAERELTRVSTATVSMRWELGKTSRTTPIPLRLRELFNRLRCEYFDASRNLTIQRDEALPAPGDRRRTQRSSNKYGWVRTFLTANARADARAVLSRVRAKGISLGTEATNIDRFGKTLSSLHANLRWTGLRGQPREAEECVFSRADGSEPELGELTDSEQMAVLIAATFEALDLNKGLVLIDSPELHLHPSIHALFFDRLCGLVSHGQLIAATSAPAILRAQPADRVLILTPR